MKSCHLLVISYYLAKRLVHLPLNQSVLWVQIKIGTKNRDDIDRA